MFGCCAFRRPELLVGALVIAIGATCARADTIDVPGDYPTIQAAIDAAVDGDEIRVAPGTYNEAIDFLGKAVWLYSTEGPDVTVIDATGQHASVVRCVSGESPATTLEGFTITGGTGTWDCDFGDCAVRGGGMFIQDSSPWVVDCIFTANLLDGGTAWWGGGAGMAILNGNPVVNSCTFAANIIEGDHRWRLGGGMYSDHWSHPLVTDTMFVGNQAFEGGAANGEYLTLIGCTFADNLAGDGGAVANVANGTIVGCSFTANRAGYGGGALLLYAGTALMGDCFFCDNVPNDILGDWIDGGGNGFCACEDSVGPILNVPDDYPTIQAAIMAACDGFEVHVSPGIYNETINFGGKAIEVRSTHGPDVTIINAQQSFHVAVFANLEGANSVLDGFTILDGRAVTLDGGGVSIYYASPVIKNCIFLLNYAGPGGRGGGLASYSGSPLLVDCKFLHNTAKFSGGGAFFNNFQSDGPTLVNCSFINNETTYSQADGGGVIFVAGGHPVVVGCLFAGNRAADRGGGLYNHRSDATIINCTFTGNIAEDADRGSGISGYQSEPLVVNSILWGNASQPQLYGPATVLHSNVEGGHPGFGNIDAEPLFVNSVHGDCRLLPGSPGIDAGANNAVPPDAFDLDDDGDTSERLPLDLDGNPRFNADELDFDQGCGVPVVVDMGAYEYQYDPVEEILVGDVDGDGVVGFVDLTEILANWGDCPADCCLADVDFSWEVDFNDLLIVLSNWS